MGDESNSHIMHNVAGRLAAGSVLGQRFLLTFLHRFVIIVIKLSGMVTRERPNLEGFFCSHG